MKTSRLLAFITASVVLNWSALSFAEEAAEVAVEPPPPPPDEIVLKNGSRILGTVIATREGVVSIETSFAGTLAITQTEIQSMTTKTPVVMQLADGEVTPEQPIAIRDETLQVLTADGSGKSYALSDLTAINPEPWELGQGYNWTGLANGSLESKKGNSDTEEIDYRLEAYWRSLKDRYSLILSGELDEANDQKSADNWLIIGKYDRFLTGNWYWGGSLSAESDQFKDLDLRYMVGPYAGRQFYEQDIFTLSGELGMAYVKEEFATGFEQDYPGANWTIRLSSNYLGGDSRLYVDHRGLLNLEETSDLVLNTVFGLAFPLLFNFEAAAEILWEHDSGSAPEIKDLDETYTFRIGYTW
jgi:hypothetical protein